MQNGIYSRKIGFATIVKFCNMIDLSLALLELPVTYIDRIYMRCLDWTRAENDPSRLSAALAALGCARIQIRC